MADLKDGQKPSVRNCVPSSVRERSACGGWVAGPAGLLDRMGGWTGRYSPSREQPVLRDARNDILARNWRRPQVENGEPRAVHCNTPNLSGFTLAVDLNSASVR